MFKDKNLSPKQLAALTALLLSSLIALSVFVWFQDWKVLLAYFIACFIAIYLILDRILDFFIYRKIKLIYKLISQTKATKREEAYQKYILPKKGIDEVREDVEEWAEQKFEEIKKLQSNEEFRKEFLQNLSHEIKTPIFSIQGYLEILADGAVEDNTAAMKYIGKSQANVQRLVQLVKVFADKNKIYQVLSNIITNAIKYGKQEGEITASIYVLEDEKVLIEISDNGIGIAEEHIPRLFERFYRTDDARSRDVGGAGLGLAICKHIIEAHGESIQVRSKINVGTTVGFTLPYKG